MYFLQTQIFSQKVIYDAKSQKKNLVNMKIEITDSGEMHIIDLKTGNILLKIERNKKIHPEGLPYINSSKYLVAGSKYKGYDEQYNTTLYYFDGKKFYKIVYFNDKIKDNDLRMFLNNKTNYLFLEREVLFSKDNKNFIEIYYINNKKYQKVGTLPFQNRFSKRYLNKNSILIFDNKNIIQVKDKNIIPLGTDVLTYDYVKDYLLIYQPSNIVELYKISNKNSGEIIKIFNKKFDDVVSIRCFSKYNVETTFPYFAIFTSNDLYFYYIDNKSDKVVFIKKILNCDNVDFLVDKQDNMGFYYATFRIGNKEYLYKLNKNNINLISDEFDKISLINFDNFVKYYKGIKNYTIFLNKIHGNSSFLLLKISINNYNLLQDIIAELHNTKNYIEEMAIIFKKIIC